MLDKKCFILLACSIKLRTVMHMLRVCVDILHAVVVCETRSQGCLPMSLISRPDSQLYTNAIAACADAASPKPKSVNWLHLHSFSIRHVSCKGWQSAMHLLGYATAVGNALGTSCGLALHHSF